MSMGLRMAARAAGMGLLLAAWLAGGAAAQTAAPAAGSGASQGNGGNAAAEQTVVEQHGVWVFECARYASAPGSPEYCTMQQVLTVNDTDDVALAVTVAFNPNSGEPVMFAMTPLGVDLPVGVGLKVDEGPQLGVPYTVCQRIGCRAAIPVTQPLLTSLKGGSTLKVSYSYRGRRIDVPVSLNGFTAAYKALEAKRPAPAATQPGGPSRAQQGAQ